MIVTMRREPGRRRWKRAASGTRPGDGRYRGAIEIAEVFLFDEILRETPSQAARRILDAMKARGWIRPTAEPGRFHRVAPRLES